AASPATCSEDARLAGAAAGRRRRASRSARRLLVDLALERLPAPARQGAARRAARPGAGGHDPTGPGGIYFDAIVIRRAKLFEKLFPWIHDGASLVDEKLINPPGVSDS